MKKIAVILISVLLIMLPAGLGHTREDVDRYLRAVEAAKAGNFDFAFMYYRLILKNYPRSEFKKEAIFAHGEYYFLMKDYTKSEEMFKRFFRNYHDAPEKLFALAYLLKMDKMRNNLKMVKLREKQIITFRQIGLIFRNYKSYGLQSALYLGMKAVFYIDKIEFYIEGEVFETISY